MDALSAEPTIYIEYWNENDEKKKEKLLFGHISFKLCDPIYSLSNSYIGRAAKRELQGRATVRC